LCGANPDILRGICDSFPSIVIKSRDVSRKDAEEQSDLLIFPWRLCAKLKF
jgi:hypothetical protein